MPLSTLLDSIPLEAIPDSIRQQHMVHVSPHLVVFTPNSHAATLEFSNEGSLPTEADVEVQFGYTYWQNKDTALVPARGERSRGYDSVVFNPRPDPRSPVRSAVEWVSGLPTHIELGPHETRRVTLRIDPPANLPNGEYYARIVTLVGAHPKRAAVSQDTREAYHYPLKGWSLPVIRDSTRVFYRQGPQVMGLKLVRAKVRLDPSNAPRTDHNVDVGMHPLQVMTQLKLTGTTHFEGEVRISYVSENGDEIQLTAKNGAKLALYRDGIIRWVLETDHLPLGHDYHLRLRFVPTQDEFPEADRLPMKPVDIELPISIPSIGSLARAVGTGQDLAMGDVDPYWSYIKGVVNYGAGGALNGRGSPAIVDTVYDYSVRQFWPWAMRSLTPGNNVNDGWLHPERSAWQDSPLGGNTMRTFVTLPGTKSGKVAPIMGRVWSDSTLLNIYVNGRALRSFDAKQTDEPSKEGYTFRIYPADGLLPGQNALDFVWLLKDKPQPNPAALFGPWYVIRVDFSMLFREMHNR